MNYTGSAACVGRLFTLVNNTVIWLSRLVHIVVYLDGISTLSINFGFLVLATVTTFLLFTVIKCIGHLSHIASLARLIRK